MDIIYSLLNEKKSLMENQTMLPTRSSWAALAVVLEDLDFNASLCYKIKQIKCTILALVQRYSLWFLFNTLYIYI